MTLSFQADVSEEGFTLVRGDKRSPHEAETPILNPSNQSAELNYDGNEIA